MTEAGHRECDRAAREALPTERKSNVFPAPCRAALTPETYQVASDRNRERLGKGLTLQTWYIVPQIRAVDAFLRTVDGATAVVHESHPEVSFAALAEDPLTDGKTTDDGIERRLAILDREPLDFRTAYEDAVRVATDGQTRPRITQTRLDDVVDAMVLAATAARGPDGWDVLPAADPPVDEDGLRMEIVRPDPGS